MVSEHFDPRQQMVWSDWAGWYVPRKPPKFLPAMAVDRPSSLSGYGGGPYRSVGKESLGVIGLGSSACKIPSRFQPAPAELAPALEPHRPRQVPDPSESRRRLGSAEFALAVSVPAGGGLDRRLEKVPGSTPGKIPKPCSDLGKMTKSVVRYEADASDPTAVWRVVHLRPVEQPRRVELEMARSAEDLRQSNLNSTQEIQPMGAPEGNLNSPLTGLSAVATGWEQDQLPSVSVRRIEWENPKDTDEGDFGIPSWGFEDTDEGEFGIPSWLFGFSLPDAVDLADLDWSIDDKKAFVEEEVLNTLNRQVRQFTGFGNTPKLYPLKPVIEEIQKSDLAQLYKVGRADRRLRSMGLLWSLPPWPGLNFCEVIWMTNGREKGAGTAAKKDSYNAVTGQSKIYSQQAKSKPFIEAGVKNEIVSAANGTPSTYLIASGNHTPQRCFSPMKYGTGTFENQNNSPGVATPPPEFCCLISMKLMSEPVMIASGQTYEREKLSQSCHVHIKQGAFLYNLEVQTLPKSHHYSFIRLKLEYFKYSSWDSYEFSACKMELLYLCKCCADNEAINIWNKNHLKREVGNVSSKHLVLALKVKSVLDLCDDNNENCEDDNMSLNNESDQDDDFFDTEVRPSEVDCYIIAPNDGNYKGHSGTISEKDTQYAVHEEELTALVREWICSRDIVTVDISDVLSSFPDISIAMVEDIMQQKLFKEPEERQLFVNGHNWGGIEISGKMRSFNVVTKEAIEISIADVSQTQIQGQGAKSDVQSDEHDKQGNYDLAAKSYERVCALYSAEGWEELLAEVLHDLAEYQKNFNDEHGYLASCVKLLTLESTFDVSSLITFAVNQAPPLEIYNGDPGTLSVAVWSDISPQKPGSYVMGTLTGQIDKLSFRSQGISQDISVGTDEFMSIKKPTRPVLKVRKPRAVVDIIPTVSSALLMNELQWIGLIVKPIDYSWKDGKSTLTDSLVTAAGITAQEVVCDVQVYPKKGIKAFSVGLHGWAFTLSNLAKMYVSKFGVDESKMTERLWGENYLDPTTKKWTIKHTGSATCKKGFVQLCYEPIKQIISTCMNDQKDKLWPKLQKLGVTMKLDEKGLTGKALMKHVMQIGLPASNALFEITIFRFPSSSKTEKHRVENLYERLLDNIYAIAFRNCDSEGLLMLYDSKMITTSDKGRKQEYVEEVPCGNTVDMVGSDQFITKNTTLTNEKEIDACQMRAMKLSVSFVVHVAVQYKVASNLPKLIESLKCLVKSDPMVLCSLEESGEHICAGFGELHLEICLKDPLKATWEDVNFIKTTFNEFYAHTISSGVPLWSAPKRFPRPLEFTFTDLSQLNFVLAASKLRAETFGRPLPDWAQNLKKRVEAVNKVISPDFLIKILEDKYYLEGEGMSDSGNA